MSVALLITDTDGNQSMVPVATEDAYSKIWQAGAKALGLEWVAAAQAGIDINPANRTELHSELARLREWFAANRHSCERIDNVVAALEKLRLDRGETAWIG